jgi:hypothetical protein
MVREVTHGLIKRLGDRAPLALALVVLNVIFIGFTAWVGYRVAIANEQQRQMILQVVRECLQLRGDHQ